MTRARDDRGSVLLLGIGLVALSMVLVAVVVDASRLFLARRSLASLADGAALSAAHQIDQAAVYTADDDSRSLPLSPTAVRAQVDAYVRANSGPAGVTRVRVLRATVIRVDGVDTVDVALQAEAALPLLGPFVSSGERLTIDAEAAARTTTLGP